MFPPIGPIYTVVVGIDWPVSFDLCNELLTLVEGAFKAAPEEKIAAEVYRLRMLTRGRDQRDESDQEAEAAIWIDQLRCYPGDIVVATLRAWPARTNGQWWPTWAEIARELDKGVEDRLALGRYLENLQRRGPLALAKPAEEEPRERRKTLEELRARYGKDWGIAAMTEGRVPVLTEHQEKRQAQRKLIELRREARAGLKLNVGPDLRKKLDEMRQDFGVTREAAE